MDNDKKEAFLAKYDLGEMDQKMEEISKDFFGDGEEEVDSADLVADSLEKNIGHWRKIHSSRFSLSVIENGYRLPFSSSPKPYEEKNNRSLLENEQWAVKQVTDLLKQKRISEVDREDIVCCNPLSVATNSGSGKKRLVIDLSRHVNEHVENKKFKIVSTESALDIIEQGSWSLSFRSQGCLSSCSTV